jgi:2-hydroxychromene-2-carboxylate isomerase
MTVQYVFDYRSPYAYLANTQLKALPAEIDYMPVDIVAVMDIVGNQPSPKCPPKARYSGMDAGRWAALYGVPLVPNKSAMQAAATGKIEQDLFSRAAIAAQKLGVFDSLHDALFTAYWGVPVDLVSSEGRNALLTASGIDADVWTLADSQEVRDELKLNVVQAAEKGVFGAPTFFVGQEMFFGNDRLDFVRHALQRAEQGGAQ